MENATLYLNKISFKALAVLVVAPCPNEWFETLFVRLFTGELSTDDAKSLLGELEQNLQNPEHAELYLIQPNRI